MARRALLLIAVGAAASGIDVRDSEQGVLASLQQGANPGKWQLRGADNAVNPKLAAGMGKLADKHSNACNLKDTMAITDKGDNCFKWHGEDPRWHCVQAGKGRVCLKLCNSNDDCKNIGTEECKTLASKEEGGDGAAATAAATKAMGLPESATGMGMGLGQKTTWRWQDFADPSSAPYLAELYPGVWDKPAATSGTAYQSWNNAMRAKVRMCAPY